MAKSVSVPTVAEFWDLVHQSGLISIDRCRRLGRDFEQVRGSQLVNGATLAQWLVAQGALTPYQVKLLMRRRASRLVIGDYAIEDRIAAGRLAGRYHARHLPTGHPVLLDYHKCPPGFTPTLLLERTRRAAARVHPHVTRTFGWAEASHGTAIVMERLDGGTVGERLHIEHRLAIEEACRIAHDATLALAPFHQSHCCYGKLRPENVWLTPSGRVKLLNEPLVDLTPNIEEPTAEEMEYLAPEQWRGEPGDARSDLWSVGMLLYTMLMGQSVYAGMRRSERLQRGIEPLSASLDRLGKRFPAPVVALVEYLLAFDPQQRYATTAAAAKALEPFCQPAKALLAEPPVPTAAAFEQWLLEHRPPPGPTPASAPPVADESGDGHSGAGGNQPAMQASSAGDATTPFQSDMPTNGTSAHAPSGGSAAKGLDRGAIVHGAAASAAAAASEEHAVAATGASETASETVVVADREDLRWRRLRRSRRPKVLVPVLFVVIAAALAVLYRSQWIDSLSSRGNKSGGVAGSSSATDKLGTPTAAPPDAPVAGGANRAQSSAAGSRPTGTATQPEAAAIATSGEALWQSPTRGPRAVPRFVPSGAQVVVALRPAAWFAHPEGDKAFRSIAPWLEPRRQQIEQMVGMPLEEIEQLWLAFSPEGERPLAMSVAALPRAAVELDVLRRQWHNPAPIDGENGQWFKADDWTYWLPDARSGGVLSSVRSGTSDTSGTSRDASPRDASPSGTGQTGLRAGSDAAAVDDRNAPQEQVATTATTKQKRWIVVGPQASLKEIAGRMGQPAALRREFESLLNQSDRQRCLNVLFTPAVLMTDAQDWFAGERAGLLRMLDDFYRDDAAGVLWSVHLDGDNLFAEMRVVPQAASRHSAVAAALKQRLDDVRREVRDWLVGHAVSPYSRSVLARYPEMLDVLVRYTRTAVVGRQIVLRTYLPSAAAHNLALATRLYLLEQAAAGDSGRAEQRDSVPSQPASVADRLAKTITLRFPRQTLEMALNLLAEEAGVPVKILGRDLQLEGITKNQSFGLDEANRPARDILSKILALASPDGKLVYTIKPDPETGQETIFITTRTAAAARGDRLPPQ